MDGYVAYVCKSLELLPRVLRLWLLVISQVGWLTSFMGRLRAYNQSLLI